MKQKIANPKSVRDSHNLSSLTITTTDLQRTQPTWAREFIPDDKFNVHLHQISRFSPIAVPAFINVQNRNSAFAVGYQQIWDPFNAFITQDKYTNGQGTSTIIPSVPYITNQDLVYFFTLNTQHLSQQLGSSEGADFKRGTYYYRFTAVGRLFYTILQNLGYRINFCAPEGGPMDSVQMSLLPLMAYAFVKYEYFTPKKFDVANGWRSFLERFRLSTISHYFNPSQGYAVSAFQSLVAICVWQYFGEDYFTSSLVSPISSLVNPSKYQIADISDYENGSFANVSSFVGDNDSHTPTIVSIFGEQKFYGSEYIHNMLTNLTRFLQKRNIVGVDTADRLLALAGVTNNAKAWRPKLLKSENSSFQVQDIISTTDTLNVNNPIDEGRGSALGENGGRLNGQCDFSFEFSADSDNAYGILIVVNTINCDYFYHQGIHRERQHIKPLDFFTPEFENEGIQAINQSELIGNVNFATPMFGPTNIFGYTNRYAEYKTPMCNLSGDFAIPSQKTIIGDAWHHSRELYDPNGNVSISEIDNNNTFMLAVRDGLEGNIYNPFDRIFVDENSDDDHIQQFNHFKVSAVRNMRSIGDYTIGDNEHGEFVSDSAAKVLNN